MTREDRAVERLAHAFTPSAWSGPGLVTAIVAFGFVGTVIVVQRVLVADSTVGWVIAGAHAVVVAVVVPVLSRRAVREWRDARDWRNAQEGQASTGVPE